MTFPILGTLCSLGAAAILFSPAAIWADEEKPPVLPAMEELSPGVYQIGKLHLDKNTNTVTFPAVLNMDAGNLEYLLVTRQGSAHESLLVTEVQPNDLHFAMLLLGAKGAGVYTPAAADAPPPQLDATYLKHAPQLKGDALTITASWKKDGAEKTAPVEDWLFNSETNKPPPRGPWIYTGSMFADGKFLAQIEGCFAALVTNPSALINNPRKGNDNDQIWEPNKKLVPPRDTPIEVAIHLEPAKK
jgi:hypothetical protein